MDEGAQAPLPGSSVHGILQARNLEWVAIPFSRHLPNPQIKPGSPALQADSLLRYLLGLYTSVSLSLLICKMTPVQAHLRGL